MMFSLEHEQQNWDRLFNTCGEATSVYQMSWAARQQPEMVWQYQRHVCGLRLFVNSVHEARDRFLRREGKVSELRKRIAAQLSARPDITGRWVSGWTAGSARRLKARGERTRQVLSMANRWATGKYPAMSMAEVVALYDTVNEQGVNLNKLKEPVSALYLRYSAKRNEIDYGDAKLTVWRNNISPNREHETLCHVSKEDPMMVVYCQGATKLMSGDEGIWTRTKPGRYLKKFYPDMSEEEVREWAQRHERKYKPVEIKFVENTDPDGWEWVYEHGVNFSSCMTYEREGRYLHPELKGEHHPVRRYAYPGNGLRLAWFGSDTEVYGRSLVVDNEDKKGFVRVYGDDRLRGALEAAGYGRQVSLQGIEIERWEAPHSSDLVVPYLDSIQQLRDEGDHLLITEYGDICGSNSNGLAKSHDTYQCDHCGASHDDEEDISYSEYEERSYCAHCDHDLVYAVVDIGRYGVERDMVDENNVVEIDGEHYADDDNLLERCGFLRCEECGEWDKADDMTATSRGWICSCTDLVEIAEEDEEGNTYAHPHDVCTAFRLEYDGDTVTLGEEVTLHEDYPFNDDGSDPNDGYVLEGSEAHSKMLQMNLELEAV